MSTAGRTVAVINQKGGVGKTTTTVNLGAGLAALGCRTCLIDLDPQAHLSLHLGIRPAADDPTVYDLLLDQDLPAQEVAVRVEPNLDLVPAETDLAAVETELATAPDRHTRLAHTLANSNMWDAVLIDCPPSLGTLTLNALSAASEVFVPMQAHFLALQGVGKLLETIGLVCGSVNPSLQVSGIVLCMHETQTTLAREVVQDLSDFLESARSQDVPWRDCRVLTPAIRRNIKLAEAPSFGQSIHAYDPTSRGAEDYLALAQDVLAMWDQGFSDASQQADVSESPAEVTPKSVD